MPYGSGSKVLVSLDRFELFSNSGMQKESSVKDLPFHNMASKDDAEETPWNPETSARFEK